MSVSALASTIDLPRARKNAIKAGLGLRQPFVFDWRKAMKTRIWLSLALGLIVAASGTMLATSHEAQAKPAAGAKAKKSDKVTLKQSLGRLSWGMSSEEAKRVISDIIMDDFRAKTDGNSDLSFVDNTRKAHTQRVENMQKSYMVLTRENSAGLGVSIVGEEFMPDANESLIIQNDDIATKYYFFKDDKLYKMAVVYDSNYIGAIAFDTFCATTAQKYGPAKNEVWDDDGNFLESVWTDKTDVKLTVKNKHASYSTFLMVFTDDSVESKLQKDHKAYYRSLNSGPEVSSAIDALTADSSPEEGSSIDDLLGKKTKVDLLAGLSQEDIDVINGKTTEKEIEKKKKAKAKRAAKDRKSDAKAKQGLEIY